VGDAITNLERALRAKPDFADAHNNLGRAFAHLGRWKEAAREFELALQEQPDFADAHFNFANLLDQAKYTNEAIAQYETVLALQPDNFGAHNNLGTVLLREGLTNEAIAHFKRVLDLQPNQRQARDNLNRIAWSLATSPQASERNGARALELAKWLMGLSGGTDPVHLATLAAAEAETGQYADAADHVAKAQKMAADGGETMAADQLGAQLRLYEAHVPYRDTNAPGRAGSK
jgi:tetratricopeptide (TPR) repeat protein